MRALLRAGLVVALFALVFVPFTASADPGQPDLVVESISFAHPPEAAAWSYTVTIKNQGTAPADLTSVPLQGYYDPDTTIDTDADNPAGGVVLSGTLAPDATQDVVVGNSNSPGQGDNYLLAYVDNTNALAETDENNNVGSIQLPQVDLVVDSISFAHPAESPANSYTVTIKNQGATAADLTNVGLQGYYDPDTTIDTDADNPAGGVTLSGSLAAGATQDFVVGNTNSPGQADKYLLAFVDDTNALAESNEANNVSSIELPDIALSLTPDANPVAGTTEKFHVDVQNATATANSGYTFTLTVPSLGAPSGTTLHSPAPAGCAQGTETASDTVVCTRLGVAANSDDQFDITLDISPAFTDPNTSADLGYQGDLSGQTPADPNAANDTTGSQSINVVARADLAVTSTVTPSGTPPAAHAIAGSSTPENYDVKVANNGPSDAVGGYKATAPLPAGTSLNSGSDPSCSISGGTITCDRTGAVPGTLAPNAIDEFHVLLDLAPSFGNATNSDQTLLTMTLTLGSFGTPQPTGSTGNDTASPSVTVYSEANLTTTKSQVTPATLPANTIYANNTASQNTVTFTVAVTNAGVSDAHNVTINDALDPNKLTGAKYCSGASCTPTTNYTGSLPIGTLASGASATFVIDAHAVSTLGHSPSGTGPYTHTNTATSSSATPAHNPPDHRTSTPVVSTTIATVPAPPTIVQFAVPGNTSGAVMWSNAGEANGGSPITGYTLRACLVSNPSTCASLSVGPTPNAMANGQSVFSYVISGLTNAAAYQFSVFATNDVGSGDSAPAGTATPSAAAFVSVIPATGLLNADTGFSGGAQTCSDPTVVTCKNIVGKYSYTDTPNAGSVYNLDAEPNSVPGSFFLHTLATPTPLLQCMDVKSLDPASPDFGVIQNSPDGCGPSNKVIRATYPISQTGAVPHLEFEQLDASITTLTRGAPCFAYSADSTGTAQCTNPAFKKIYTDTFTGKPTNFCPTVFNPSSTTGWTAQKPCAFVNYITVRIPGFNIIGTSPSQPIRGRPLACSPDGNGNCGKAAIIGSSLTLGVIKNGNPVVPGWCSKNLAVVPCIFKIMWLNNGTNNGNNDVQIQDYEVGDMLKGAGSG